MSRPLFRRTLSIVAAAPIRIWDPDDGTVAYGNLVGSDSDYFGAPIWAEAT